MNDRSRQNPAYRPTRYAPLTLTGWGAPFCIDIKLFIYIDIEYPEFYYSLLALNSSIGLRRASKRLTSRLFFSSQKIESQSL